MGDKALERQLRSIADFDRADLKSEWQRRLGSTPDRYLSTQLMRRSLLHEAQVRALGGLSARDRRTLGLTRAKKEAPLQNQTAALTSGTQLMREWNGRMYTVSVTDCGFELDGRSYRSLTAVAKQITGAHWSGPRFFGVA